MSSTELNDRIKKKMQEIEDRVKRDKRLPNDNATMYIISRMFLRTQEKTHYEIPLAVKRCGPVDTSVMMDPLGNWLYRFGWNGELPGYLDEEWFIREAMQEWTDKGEDGRTYFKNALIKSDKEMYGFLKDASNDVLFGFYLDGVVRAERSEAGYSLMRMGNRTMKEDEYMTWAKKLGVSLNGL